MMLTNLRIQNFKSWRDTGAMRFAPLTGFFGTNSSGKSSILQFLLLLKQTAESNDPAQVLNLGAEPTTYVDLGSFTEITHHTNTTNPFTTLVFQINWVPLGHTYFSVLDAELFADQVPVELTPLSDATKLQQVEPFGLEVHVGLQDDRLVLERLHFSFKRIQPLAATLALQQVEEVSAGQHYQFNYQFLAEDGSEKSDGYPTTPGANNLFALRLWELVRVPSDLNDADFIDKNSRIVTSKLEAIHQSLILLLRNIRYLGPLREYPNRLYLWRGSSVEQVGVKGEQAIQALLSTKFETTNGSSTAAHPIQQVAGWLKQLGLIESFTIQPIAENRREYEVIVRQTPNSPPVLLTQIGFGISQVLPVLAICALADERSTIILEQPEIHLHPAAQSKLADVLIEVMLKRKVQIILESHSEHLLRRLQRRIAEEALLPEQVALYFTRIEDGESKLEELQIDEYGNISNWPPNFFGDEMGDLVAMVEAAMHRQGANGTAAMEESQT